jgi:hypothetical protein
MTDGSDSIKVETARVPSNGWDEPFEVRRAIKFLAALDGDYVDGILNIDVPIETIRSYGIAPDRCWTMMLERWPILDREPDLRQDLRMRIRRAYVEGERPPGYDACGDEFEENRKPEFGGLGITVRRVSDVEIQPIYWIWPERIPRGKLTLFAGFPDQGKSQVLLNVAATISTGGEWPNGEGKAPQGVVIYLSTEDDTADSLKPRLLAAGADIENVLTVEPMVRVEEKGRRHTRVFNIDDDLRQLTRTIELERARGKIVRAVMFDPFNSYFGGARKADSHNSADMRALLTPIAAWAAQMQVAVCGIMHFNKAENSHQLYRITGSMSVAAAARAVWYCTKDPDSDAEQFVMVQGKHNLSKRKAGLSYRIEERDVGEKGIRAPYVEWIGPSTLTPEEAFAVSRREREPEAVNTALKYLKDAFAGVGVILTGAELEDCRKSASVSDHTWRRAKEQLGLVDIKPKRIGDPHTFRLRTAFDEFEADLGAHS